MDLSTAACHASQGFNLICKTHPPGKQHNNKHLVHNESNINNIEKNDMSVGLHTVAVIVQFQYFTFHIWTNSCRDCLLSPPKSTSVCWGRFLWELVCAHVMGEGGGSEWNRGRGERWGCQLLGVRLGGVQELEKDHWGKWNDGKRTTLKRKQMLLTYVCFPWVSNKSSSLSENEKRESRPARGFLCRAATTELLHWFTFWFIVNKRKKLGSERQREGKHNSVVSVHWRHRHSQ